MNLSEIAKYFDINGSIVDIKENKNGLINKSYIVHTTIQDYIIQKINNIVFKNPYDLMNNIEKVIKHLNNKNNFTCENLILIPTRIGKNCLEINREYYRCYNFVKNSITYDKIENENQLYEMGKILGEFQNNLNDFDPNTLNITIKDFHNTESRYKQLVEAFKSSDISKQQEVIPLLFYIIDNNIYFSKIVKKLEHNKIPLRVVHNDTKLNNVIFDKNTKKAKCLIDLDTVMPGSLLYDFGDALRSSVSTVEEDSIDYELIDFDIKKFTYFFLGYYYKIMNIITSEEIELLVDSIYIITMEITMRFLTDYLSGSKYFSINYEKHNLNRAKNQIILAKIINNKKKQLEYVINAIMKHFEILK